MRLIFHQHTVETKSRPAALFVRRNSSTFGSPNPWGPSPVPMCPCGRVLACPERARMRLPSLKGGPIHWRKFGESSTLLKYDKQCRLSIRTNRRAETAAARDREIRCSPCHRPECGICGQAPGSSPCRNNDSSRHRRCAEGCNRIRRMHGDDFRAGSAAGHGRHAVGW